MRRDQFAERQSLVQLYKEMGDVELHELSADIANLTEVAQEVLRDEMKIRGLNQPRGASDLPQIAEHPPAPLPDLYGAPPMIEYSVEDSDQPSEFTWKTPLCVCEDGEQAGQLQAALRAAGIESWIEGSGYRVTAETLNPRVLVAADQLEQAQEIAARPISQAIVEQSRMEIPEYEPPVCPKCGAEDPVMESSDPVNSWLCEDCGAQWTDPVEESTESAAR
jgi:ribosomal protein L37AE/L43A